MVLAADGASSQGYALRGKFRGSEDFVVRAHDLERSHVTKLSVDVWGELGTKHLLSQFYLFVEGVSLEALSSSSLTKVITLVWDLPRDLA